MMCCEVFGDGGSLFSIDSDDIDGGVIEAPVSFGSSESLSKRIVDVD